MNRWNCAAYCSVASPQSGRITLRRKRAPSIKGARTKSRSWRSREPSTGYFNHYAEFIVDRVNVLADVSNSLISEGDRTRLLSSALVLRREPLGRRAVSIKGDPSPRDGK
jgi:hypothetical protein